MLSAAGPSTLGYLSPISAMQEETMSSLAPLDLSFYHRTETLLGRLQKMATDQCRLRMSMDNLHDAQDPSFQLPVVTFGDETTLTAQSPRRLNKVLINFGAHGRELISSTSAAPPAGLTTH